MADSRPLIQKPGLHACGPLELFYQGIVPCMETKLLFLELAKGILM